MRVVVTDRRFEGDPYREAIEDAGGEIVYRELYTEDEVIEGTRDADVIVSLKSPITRRVIEELEDVRLIQRAGAGYDNINVKAASEHGIPVSNIPGKYCADELSEHAIALMFAAARDVVDSDASMREANGWDERPDVQMLQGGTFGIVGLGYIGRAAVPKAEGVGMNVVAYDPYLPDDVFESLGVERVSFDELLDRSDCISIHAQLTQENTHLFGPEEFEAMQDTAVLVNTARGAIVDEAALAEAVVDGEIWGAGIDVFEDEPPVDSPVFETTRIVCSPHHGARCGNAKENAIRLITEELVRAVAGDQLQHVVNPDTLMYGEDDPVDVDRYDVEDYQT